MIAGSRSPERVPIVTPASGVNPIEVSIDLPFSTAVILAPFPKWHVIKRNLLRGISKTSDAFSETYLCEVPWNPYFLPHIFHSIHKANYTEKIFQASSDGKQYQIQQPWER